MKSEQTIFHKIIAGEIPADIVYQDEQLIAFKDVAPAAPTHLLIVPKKTIPTINQVTAADEQLLGHMLVVARELAHQQGVADDGYRLVINVGERAGQSVFQLHLHLLSGREFSWPPG